MRKAAELNTEDDKKRREQVEEKNETDNLVYQTEKLLAEHRDKIPEEDAKQIEAALEDAKNAVKEADIQAVRNAKEVLQKASYRLAEFMYQQAGADSGDAGASNASTGGGGASSDDDVIDAEIVDSEEKK